MKIVTLIDTNVWVSALINPHGFPAKVREALHKHFVIGLVILALALLASVALAQGEGVIEARVLNGTGGGGSVEGLAVTLHAFRGMTEELDPQTTVTDAQGRVRFEGLDTSPDITYVLSAAYADVEYDTLPLSFEKDDQTMLAAALEVYEATEDPNKTAIQIEQTHVFVGFQDRVMSVGELHIFTNTGDRTFVGVEDSELGQRVTLRFALPEGATGLRFQVGGEGDRYVTTEDGFADTEVVRPGTSQQVLYGYTLNYDGMDTFDFVKPLLYPTANLNVLVPRVGVDVTSEQVELSEIRTVEGQVYLNLNGIDFAAGDQLSVHFSGLQNIMIQAEAPDTLQRGLEPKWIALGLAALALAGGLIYPLLRGPGKVVPAGQPVEPAGAQLTPLLQAIADLDDALELGSLDEASYREQRQALKNEALALMRES